MAQTMQKVESSPDFDGHKLEKGDTVLLLSDNSSAKIADLARDEDQYFVRLRPLHQPYGKGVWHAADRVVFQSAGRKNKKTDSDRKSPSAKPK